MQQFYDRYGNGPVLDVGVSRANKDFKYENIFLHRFRGDRLLYTGLGVEDLSDLAKLYSQSRFVTYEGRLFPFQDGDFEWVFSNAVIEHVGQYADQLLFLNEMMRVGENVFLLLRIAGFRLRVIPMQIFFIG